ncbi:chromosome partitioning ATPase (plasmid) [Paraoerskovia sediminicola]|uniref:Chromosome partitioning ATPase n=2 Tax=Paraoerskovia sediminicola TaxID=1138587 RepID=A0ABN6XGM1_9CELL|nr:chromosome partitioning ATPase [Paraoerskovia sediminicola]
MPGTVDRTGLDRVIAVINGKGGVGKTTIAANVAGLLAKSGYRVLAVDMDPQGNLGLDLGYSGGERDDDGQSLATALTFRGGNVEVARGIRENLDVMVGGSELHHAQAALAANNRKRDDPREALASLLAPIAADYDLILIDCPPGGDALQQAAITAARWAIVPAKVDAGSERGLREVADRLEAVLDLNPDLDLLGVALFAVDTSATRVQHEARNMIAESVGDPDVLFRATIRHSSAVAQAVRTRGLLVHELEDEVRAAPPWWKIRRGEATDGAGGPRTATSVADDFHALTMEIVERLSAGEQEEVSA